MSRAGQRVGLGGAAEKGHPATRKAVHPGNIVEVLALSGLP
jgi:hypothetical protein